MKAVEAGHRVQYKSAFDLLEDIAEATATGMRRSYIAEMTRIPLLIIEDLGLRRVPESAAEDLLEILHRRYQKTSTIISSNRPLEDWGTMLGGDTAATSALLDRFLHTSEVTFIRGKSYRLYERQQRDTSVLAQIHQSCFIVFVRSIRLCTEPRMFPLAVCTEVPSCSAASLRRSAYRLF